MQLLINIEFIVMLLAGCAMDSDSIIPAIVFSLSVIAIAITGSIEEKRGATRRPKHSKHLGY